MDAILLEKRWSLIKYSGNYHFDFVRIDTICIPELNVGLNGKLNRCLILELPKTSKVELQSIVKKNLSIEFFKEEMYIIIQLTDDAFSDLFNDFIISIYNKIKSISEVGKYSSDLVQTFYKWSEFFENKGSSYLSVEMIKGLFGELLVLQSLITESSALTINDVLNGWRGPYDQKNDFVLLSKNIEVKTTYNYSLEVIISSEFQLEVEAGKGLELWVINLENDLTDGITLSDLTLAVKNEIINKLGDTSKLFKALLQKGIQLNNLNQYDNYKFKPIKETVYDCTAEGFPKLIKSNISPGINNLKYNILIHYLTDFIVKEREL